MAFEATADRSNWLTETIRGFINRSPENSLQTDPPEKAFSDPLVGFSRGDDPLYTAFKEYVGPFHLTPCDIFSHAFPELNVTPEELTVISWILPQTQATKSDNRKETLYPSERWARARIYGEGVNNALRKHVAATLASAGYDAVAPTFSPLWEKHTSERFGFASSWSERHAAYACGLGTFGLCDGLITPRGKAMRTGSVVARIEIDPTPRPYTDHRAYCLFYSKGTCGRCIPRCPVDAITEKGHDKEKCLAHLKPATADYVKTHYGFNIHACGLCQTKVPCESKIPTVEDLQTIADV